MSNWTLTPDGLKTDEQLWVDDFLRDNSACPGCGYLLVRARPNDFCMDCWDPFGVKDPVGALIACAGCGRGWCKVCLGDE